MDEGSASASPSALLVHGKHALVLASGQLQALSLKRGEMVWKWSAGSGDVPVGLVVSSENASAVDVVALVTQRAATNKKGEKRASPSSASASSSAEWTGTVTAVKVRLCAPAHQWHHAYHLALVAGWAQVTRVALAQGTEQNSSVAAFEQALALSASQVAVTAKGLVALLDAAAGSLAWLTTQLCRGDASNFPLASLLTPASTGTRTNSSRTR